MDVRNSKLEKQYVGLRHIYERVYNNDVFVESNTLHGLITNHFD